MTTPDQRRFPRVEFFLVPDANEQLPVWVIKPESETVGRAGVVVNLSGGGQQIATSCGCCWAKTKACRCSAPMSGASGAGR